MMKLKLMLLSLLVSASTALYADSLGTSFTYQGQLNASGAAANGTYDFIFALYNSSSSGTEIGNPIITNGLIVSNGLFSTSLDFGNRFDGTASWLTISVRTNNTGNYILLTPRQPLTPTPNALFANTASNLSGLLPAAQLSGAIPVTQLSGTLGNGQLANSSVTVTAGTGLSGGGLVPLGGSTTVSANLNHDATLTGNGGATSLGLNLANANTWTASQTINGSLQVTGNVQAARLNIGSGNTLSGTYATIAGGEVNAASGFTATIGGGYQNTANNSGAMVGGGQGNTAGGTYATVAGGWSDKASGDYATVAGGYQNTASGIGSFVGGGGYGGFLIYGTNLASGGASVIGGGIFNVASGQKATVAGGNANTAGGDYATVAGGQNNTAGNQNATVGGGNGNIASGSMATVGGGQNNTASSFYATVAGGYGNTAGGQSSFAAGQQANALHDGAFVWSDNSNPTTSTAPNQFIVRASGGVTIYSSSGTAGTTLPPGGTAWQTISDRNAKKNIQPVKALTVLEKLAAIPIQQWNYNWENDTDVPNIGPMAQDFKHAFYPGRDDKAISTLEFDGVELAAIQGLNLKLREKDVEIQALQRRLERLERALSVATENR
jgi:trimeric autotransporter adhesin